MGFVLARIPSRMGIHMYNVQAVLHYLIIVVLAFAVVGKLRDRSAMTEMTDIAEAIRLPRWLARRSGPLLVAAETSIVVVMLVPSVSAWGSAAAALLFLGLTHGAYRAIRLVNVPRCRCFGGAGTTLGRRHVARNAVLFLAAAGSATILFTGNGGGPRTLGEHVLTATVGLMSAVVMTYLDALTFLGGWEDRIGINRGGN